MTEEQIKTKAKEYFPNDEFKQQAVIDAINWATKELQKENAELKADFIKSCKVKEQGFREAEQALERKDEQLTKAKELIKKLCEAIHKWDYKNFEEVEKEAEQFLSEVEK